MRQIQNIFTFSDCVASIDSYDAYFIWGQVQFLPNAVFENNCDSVDEANYWIGPFKVGDIGFSIDRNCVQQFNEIILKNTHNGYFNNRSQRRCYGSKERFLFFLYIRKC